MKQRIKKQISAGTISGRELLKTNRPKQDISFRTGAHMTEKDRPRKKMKPKDYRREDW
jgi:hypothetical protein